MKHDLLEEVWHIRDQIGMECGYDPKRLAALVRQEEVKAGKRLVRAPKRRPPRRRAMAST
jgi:hypothetical protein